MVERIIDRINKPIIYVNTDSEPATTRRRKRAATNTSPKQRRHKEPKKRSSPSDALSATNSLSGKALRRPSRRQKPTFKVREKQQREEDKEDQEEEAEKAEDDEDDEEESRGQQQLTLSQFGQTKAVVRRLGAMKMPD